MRRYTQWLLCFGAAFQVAIVSSSESNVRVTNVHAGFRAERAAVAIECSRDLRLQTFLKRNGTWRTLSVVDSIPAVSVKTGEQTSYFVISGPPTTERSVRDVRLGIGDRISVSARDAASHLELGLTFDFPNRYPDVVVIRTRITNLQKDRPVTLSEVRQLGLSIRSPLKTDPRFWSLQGGGYKWGADYIFPIGGGFRQDNYTGPKGGKGYGGGFPLVDLWCPEMGVTIALLDPKPTLAWLPVEVSNDGLAMIQATRKPNVQIPPAGSYTFEPAMIVAHAGDFYDGMVRYRQLMTDFGVGPVTDYDSDNYEPAWCTWGYQRKFTMGEVLAKLPQMQEMKMMDFILDDGWFDLFGNWRPSPAKFPNGEADMKAAVARIHAAGRKFRLWWSPGSADPGSDIDRNHPDWYILDKSGQKEKASWNAYYLCPAYPPVRKAMLELVRHFVTDWSTDSFKIDGSDLNHAPLCYNPAHHHKNPEESFEQWPEMFRQIREEARRLKPGFRVELCPCGITPTYQLVTAMDQPTDSDPLVHQVTSRTKFLKAMFGSRSPVLQEYVGVPVPDAAMKPSSVDIYPRAIGTGEVISTFTTNLGTENARWTAVYNRHRPAEGEYLNLYDIGWEKVEGHVIRKDEIMYYGFFSPKPGDAYDGTIQVRGLEKRRYKLTDYVNDRSLGVVTGPVADVRVSFKDSLLLVAVPER